MVYITNIGFYNMNRELDIKNKTPGLSPPANYTDRVTAACRRILQD
jgi:hypothetical protein